MYSSVRAKFARDKYVLPRVPSPTRSSPFTDNIQIAQMSVTPGGSLSVTDDFSSKQGIKCVVVGTRGAGKSHIICARACGTKYTLRELIQSTHVSTIWAIDQYRDNEEVRSRSWCSVDGVNCLLRLWDTFGSLDKDRQFAYSCADVVIVCYSVINRKSLHHLESHWFPEIHRYCPDTPIVVCACQIDMRYLYNDPAYTTLPKGSFFRKLTAADIVWPEEGRQMAKKLGAVAYYETSVLVPYGIQDLFTNSIRAGLAYKRRQKLLSSFGNLKNVTKPHIQVPHLPPKPPPPEPREVSVDASATNCNVLDLQVFCDVVFVVGGYRIKANQVCLIAASPVFQQMFLEGESVGEGEGESNDLDPDDNSSLLSASLRPLKSVGTEITLRRMSAGEETSFRNEDCESLLFPQSVASDAYLNKFDYARTTSAADLELSADLMNGVQRAMFYGLFPHAAASDGESGVCVDGSATRGVRARQVSEKLKKPSPSERNGEGEYQPGSNRHRSVSARTFNNNRATDASVMFGLDTESSGIGSQSSGVGQSSADLLDSQSLSVSSNTGRFSSSSDGRDSRCLTHSASVESCIPSAFLSLTLEEADEDSTEKGEKVVVVTIDDSVSPRMLRAVLDFLYTGVLPKCDLLELKRVASMMGVAGLEAAALSVLNGDEKLTAEILNKFKAQLDHQLSEVFLKQALLSDVRFDLDDGTVDGHRALMVGRSDMMLKMFCSDFAERSARAASFPGVSRDAFRAVQEYLYIGRCPAVCKDWLGVLELANRLCLDQLFAQAEVGTVRELTSLSELGNVTAEYVLELFNLGKLYGAGQLVEWCTWFLMVDYKDISEKHTRALEALPINVQDNLARNRWPPTWYLKEVEVYEKALAEMKPMKPEHSWLKRSDGQAFIQPGGCFFFTRRK